MIFLIKLKSWHSWNLFETLSGYFFDIILAQSVFSLVNAHGDVELSHFSWRLN